MDARTPHKVVNNPTMGKVVGAMARFAHGDRGKENLDVRGLVENIIRDVESGDYAGECLAVYYWVHKNIRYVKDPVGVELVKDPVRVLKTGTGDCDDIALLLAAMLMSIGHHCTFHLVGFAPGAPPTHVFCAVRLPGGAGDLVLDPVANRVTRGMLSTVKASRVIDLGETDEDAERNLGYDAGDAHADPAAGQVIPRTFSVYDYARKTYRYYEGLAGAVPATGGFRKRRPAARGAPEGIAAQVPSGARQVGEGKRARGTIATLGEGAASFGSVSLFATAGGLFAQPWVKPALVVGSGSAAAYVAWRWWRGRKRRSRDA